MRHKSVRLLAAAEINFFVMLGICYWLDPNGPTDADGISYFGNFLLTIVPYAWAFIGSAILIWLAAHEIDLSGKFAEWICRALKVLAFSMVALVFLPSLLDSVVGKIHVAVGSCIFLDQLAVAAWFAHWLKRSFIHYGLLVLMVASGIAAGLSIRDFIDVMFIAQVAFQAIAGILYIGALAYIMNNKSAEVREAQGEVEVLSSE